MSINPEWEAANEMARLIQYPSALAVEKFRGGMTLLRVVIPEKSVLNGMSVAEFAVKISRQILVCIVKRGKEIRIPDGNFVLMAGDALSLIHISRYGEILKYEMFLWLLLRERTDF